MDYIKNGFIMRSCPYANKVFTPKKSPKTKQTITWSSEEAGNKQRKLKFYFECRISKKY